MTTLHIRKHIDSATLFLPELQSLIGKTVEITVREEPALTVTPGQGDWSVVERAAGTRAEWEAALADLTDLDIDWDAYQRQREFDTQRAQDHRP